jgi:uncharacterized protein (TIGR03086 family)
VYLVDFAEDQGSREVPAAALLGVVGGASIVGRLALGVVVLRGSVDTEINDREPRGVPPMTVVDLEPATRRMADLIGGVPDARLDGPTPCPAYTVGDLLDHVGGLTLAFTAAATKATGAGGPPGPSGDVSRLGDDWRTRIPRDLAALAEAWRDPTAWSGTTQAGGVELPGEVAGLVALDELVIHAWDVARASGQPYDCDHQLLAVVHDFVAQFSGPGQEAARAGLFGPQVEVQEDAPLLDRVIGLTGRDPAWSPTTAS